MNYPQNGWELVNWPVQYGEDKRGRFTIITGYEGTGKCHWCGTKLPDDKRRYCKGRSHDGHLSCYRLYHEHFDWSFAAPICFRRYEHRCALCGKWGRGWEPDPSCPTTEKALEVHHIVPLDGGKRTFSPYNQQWNLILICHECHVGPEGIHAAMRLAGQQVLI